MSDENKEAQAKVIAPEGMSVVMVGDKKYEVKNGESTVPVSVAKTLVASHGFKFASDELDKKVAAAK